jgi:hypothetical protein
MEENRNTLKKSDDIWLCLKIAIWTKIAIVVVVAVAAVGVALLNYCEFRHGCTSICLLRISSWLQVG